MAVEDVEQHRGLGRGAHLLGGQLLSSLEDVSRAEDAAVGGEGEAARVDEDVGDADGVFVVVVGAVEGGDGAVRALDLRGEGGGSGGVKEGSCALGEGRDGAVRALGLEGGRVVRAGEYGACAHSCTWG